MFEIGIGAYIGADLEQRGFDYDRVLTAVTDLRPWSLLMLAAALVLLLTSVTALIWGNRPILVLLACAIALLSLRAVLDVDDRLGWPGSGGVIGYEEPKGGPLLQPAIDELKGRCTPVPGSRCAGLDTVGWRRRVPRPRPRRLVAASAAHDRRLGPHSIPGFSPAPPSLAGGRPHGSRHVRGVPPSDSSSTPSAGPSEPSAGLNGPHPSRRVKSRIAACAGENHPRPPVDLLAARTGWRALRLSGGKQQDHPFEHRVGTDRPKTAMRMRGLEPPRPYGHTDLNRARLPIPPHPLAASV